MLRVCRAPSSRAERSVAPTEIRTGERAGGEATQWTWRDLAALSCDHHGVVESVGQVHPFSVGELPPSRKVNAIFSAVRHICARKLRGLA